MDNKILTRGQIENLLDAHEVALDRLGTKTGRDYDRIQRAIALLRKMRDQSDHATEQPAPLSLIFAES